MESRLTHFLYSPPRILQPRLPVRQRRWGDALEIGGMESTCPFFLSPHWLSGFRRLFVPFFRVAPLVSAFPPRHPRQSPHPLAAFAEGAGENHEATGNGTVRCRTTGAAPRGSERPAQLCPSASTEAGLFPPAVTCPNVGFVCFSRQVRGAAQFTLPRTDSRCFRT